MKKKLIFIVSGLLLFMVLGCSSDDNNRNDGWDKLRGVDTSGWTDGTFKAAETLIGRWKLVYEGIDQGKVDDYKIYAEFGNDGMAKYEKNFGEANYTYDSAAFKIENDWVYDKEKKTLSGHIYCPLFGYEGYFFCTIGDPEPDYLYITPDSDDKTNFLVDPGLGFKKVK